MSSSTDQSSKKYSPYQKTKFKVVPFKYRYGNNFGSTFRQTFHFLMESIEWSKQKIEDYQNQEFLKLIHHAYLNVPYYRELFDNNAIHLNDIKSIGDIEKIPYLTKKIINNNKEKLIASNFSKPYHQFSTSGSTGEKLTFFGTDNLYKKEAAFVLRSYKLSGSNLYDKDSIWLRRYVPKNTYSPLYYYDYELKRHYMSAYHINESNIFEFAKYINQTSADTIAAYPSSAYILATLCEKFDLKLPKIQHIHLASEMVLDEWADKIEEVFGFKPVAHYGSIEKVIFMHQIKGSYTYFENKEYGVTEYLQNDVGSHSLVGTGFLNYLMPFIRYKTEDNVLITDNKSRFNTVEKIYGRSTDILISSDGTKLPGVNFFSWVNKDLKGVKLFQIIQDVDKSIEFNFVPEDNFDDKTLIEIQKGLVSRLGELKISINKKNEIYRSKKTNKYKCIINKNF